MTMTSQDAHVFYARMRMLLLLGMQMQRMWSIGMSERSELTPCTIIIIIITLICTILKKMHV
jgi:hypothetical protein